MSMNTAVHWGGTKKCCPYPKAAPARLSSCSPRLVPACLAQASPPRCSTALRTGHPRVHGARQLLHGATATQPPTIASRCSPGKPPAAESTKPLLETCQGTGTGCRVLGPPQACVPLGQASKGHRAQAWPVPVAEQQHPAPPAPKKALKLIQEQRNTHCSCRSNFKSPKTLVLMLAGTLSETAIENRLVHGAQSSASEVTAASERVALLPQRASL